MKLLDKMRQQKLLSMTLLLFTLSIGIVIGTLVNTGVHAQRTGVAAPDATPLVLPKAVQTELKECMLVLPASIPALGMGMAMLKPIVPQLRQAREQMRSLSPAEQDEVAAALAAEIAPLPKEQRAEFIEHLGSGFFPPRVSDGVKQRLAVK